MKESTTTLIMAGCVVFSCATAYFHYRNNQKLSEEGLKAIVDYSVAAGYIKGRHDVVEQWYKKCRKDILGDYPEPPGTKLLSTYCGSEMKNLIGVENVWPGEFP